MTKKATTKAEEIERKDAAKETEETKTTAAKKSEKKRNSKTAKAAENSTKKRSEDPSKESKKLTKEINSLKEKLEETEKKEGEWHDKYLRLSAEFDNYRKRTLTEKVELTKQANAEILKDLLSVIDDFERGMDNVDKSEDVNALRQGIHLIYSKFIEFTRQNGVKEIDAKEQEFDVDFHEALTKIPAPSDDLKGKVVEVIEKGYLLNDKVIRYSKVVVGE